MGMPPKLLLYFFALCFGGALASHFRGAVIQFRPVDPTQQNGMIEIRHRIAWRRSSTLCTQSIIASGILIGQSGSLTCRDGCGGTLGSMQFMCTDFSEQEDWSAGERSYTTVLPQTTDYFEASYSGNAWIGLVIGGGRWEVRVKGNLTMRQDIGRINTSPITTATPILRLQHGCNHTVTIPVEDADGDTVRCRWAESAQGECAGVCMAFPATLDEVECTLTYSATGLTGFYVVALQVEDFARPTDTIPMSSVPVQFLVLVFSSSENCTNSPTFAPPARVDGSCVAVPFNSTYSEGVIAESGGPTVRITEIVTASPSGLTRSEIFESFESRQWSINVSWTPGEDQAGLNIFCYTALDSAGLSSKQSCITLVVGVEAPNLLLNTITPTGLIFPNFTSDWTIQLDGPFSRTPRSRYIRIYDEYGRLVLRINAASSNDVTHPSTPFERTLRFRPRFTLIEKMSYYVLLDPGVAVGPEFCKPESPSLTDPNTWRVTIADITPPILTLVNNPFFSNANITISWRYDEETSSSCTLQTPTDLFVIICNESVSLTGLREGIHTLYIVGTDLAGNVARTVRKSWTVDLTPPTILLQETPSAISNQISSTFRFRCVNERQCSFMCSVHVSGGSPQFAPCFSSRRASNLQNGVNYIFSIVATDGVGNVGNVMTYTWIIDLVAPTINDILDITVACGEDFSPAAVGEPTVTDNEDLNPSLTYMDVPQQGCILIRVWNASDNAGNSAAFNQTIQFSNPRLPTVSSPRQLSVACGSIEDASANLAHNTISVSHPCNRPLSFSFSDSANITQCGLTLSRVWRVEDDCGLSIVFNQTIRVLDQQFPDGPMNGFINAHLDEILSWPQFPGATSYQVYVWIDGEEQPTEPTSVLVEREYTPTSNYPPGTRILWQIEYVVGVNMTVPSPIWGFETERRPDLLVTDVTVPAFAFSGQMFTVSWTVINTGNLSITISSFSDSIYMGRTTSFSDSQLVQRTVQRRFLDVNDGYTSEAEIDLENDDIGLFYIFIFTDSRNQVSGDVDRENNIRSSTAPLQVRLTPPPNLNVQSIVSPSSVFSDTTVNIRWTVINNGLGVTGASDWHDRLYLSTDNQTDGRDVILHTLFHRGVLPVGASYTESVSIQVPHAIFGNFFFIVVTDLFNNVYEHVFENDNTMSSQFEVILSPPPDLVVSSLQVSSFIRTGDNLLVSYVVTNEGAGSSFERLWTDFITMSPMLSSQRGPAFFHRRYNRLEAGASYSVNVTFFILPTFISGQYTLSVHTDYRNQVFELSSDNNNMRSTLVTVLERLPDLVISSFSYTVEPTILGNILRYSYRVQNNGSGATIGAPWSDRLSTSLSPTLSGGPNTELYTRSCFLELPSGDEYNASVTTTFSQAVHGNRYLYLMIDARNQIVEENNDNNLIRSTRITIPPLFPDLAVQILEIVDTPFLVGGENILLEWSVINRGELTVPAPRWYDSIYLSPTQDLADAVKLADVFVSTGNNILDPQMTYRQMVNVTLPLMLDYTLSYYVIVEANSRGHFDENNRLANNLASIVSDISSPPSPDLQVTYVRYIFFPSSRVLTVEWSVRNIGNTMRSVMSWRDQIIISPDPSFMPSGNIILGNRRQVLKLQTDQFYTLRETVFLPSTTVGVFYVYVMADASNSVMEINGEDNNILRSENTLAVSPPPVVTLEISINTDNLPSSYFTGQRFVLEYSVRNIGEAAVSATSWVDGVYLSDRANPSRSYLLDNSFQIAQTLNSMQLGGDETYTVSISITLPHQINDQQFLAVLLDVNDVLNVRTMGTIGILISIEQGSLPDLVVSAISNDLNITSGQPATIDYSVRNQGESEATGLWYEALILSQDSEVDPFDTRLKTVSNPQPSFLMSNQSYNQSIEVFIPYDLPTSFYYIIIIVDTRNDLFEERDDNNEASLVVFITEAVSTDLTILDVQLSPSSVNYGDMIDYRWQLRNNGSILARGYKCDSIYLSEDDEWDISDFELDLPQCNRVTVNAFNNDARNDISNLRTAIAPFVAQQDYYGIVRTRTNIRDPNLNNNIGSSSSLIQVNAPSITLGTPTSISLEPNDVRVFRIDGVPGEETLISSLTTEQVNVYHDLYVQYRQTPTGALHDAFSQFSLSSSQRAVVRHSRSGTYYLRVESFTNSEITATYNVEILVKIAQFEILEVLPVTAAPLGNVTIKVSGTVLGYLSSAALIDSRGSVAYQSSRIYWFNSELVYATFDLSSAELGDYSVRLTDEQTGRVAQLNNSFTIAIGVPGRLLVNVQPPRPLRTGEVGSILVQIQNDGNTDLLSPHLVLVSRDQIVFRLVDVSGSIDFSDRIDFLGLSLEGPGGILSPGARTVVEFRVAQIVEEPNRATYRIQIQNNGSAPHAYLNQKSRLQPIFIPSDIWDTVWENFLKSVGTTQQSFQQRMSEIASQLSLIGKRTYSIQEMVQYQLRVAFGLLSGDVIMSLEDLFDETEASYLPFTVVRVYSAYIHKRRTTGPMGRGWLLDLWELRIDIGENDITLWRQREAFVFRRDVIEETLYVSNEERMIRTPEGVYYFDAGGVLFYLFDSQSGMLIQIGGYLHNATLNLHYSENRLQYMEHSRSGKRLNVNYTTTGLIQSMQIINANNIVEKTNYDSTGTSLLSVSDGDAILEYVYNDNGDLISATDRYGTRSSISYNENSWIDRIERFDSNSELLSSTGLTITWSGRVDIFFSPDNTSRTLIHDRLGNVVSTASNNGLPVVTVELPFGRRVLLGDEVVTENREVGNALYTIDANGVEYKYVRDDAENLVLFEDGDGYDYTFTYNQDGLQTSSGYPDGTRIEFTYDDEGHLQSLVNPDSSTINFAYDDDDNLIQRRSLGSETFFEYDASRLLISAFNRNSRASIVYNNRRFPIEVQYSSGYTLYYGYNRRGQRSYLADNQGYNVSYTYDSEARLIEIRKSSDDSLISRFDYSNGVLRRKTLGNGAYSSYLYNEASQLVQLDNYLPNQTLSSSNRYDYDRRGRVTKMTDESGQTWRYRYDPTGQLTGWTSSNGESIRYTYDNRGNRLVTERGESVERYSVNEMNQYTLFNETDQFSYDLNGNLIRKVTQGGTESYGFDAEGRLTSTETLTERCAYFYDAFGNLDQKNCTSGSRQYLVDPFGAFGEDIIAEISENGTSYFVHSREQGLIAALDSNGNPDLFYEFNMDGAVEKILDMNGNIINSYKYDAFGRITYRSEQIRSIFKYSGLLGVLHNEELVDVYMMRARHYDAQLGRFISLDLTGLNGKSPNYYMYALNNPLTIKDPSGRVPLLIPVIGAVIGTTVHLITTPRDMVSVGSVLGAATSGALSTIPGGTVVRAGVVAVGSSIGGDIVRYGVDYLRGNQVGGAEVGAALHNAGFSLAWSLVPGRFIFMPIENLIKRAGVKDTLTFLLTKPREALYNGLSKLLYDRAVMDDISKFFKDQIDSLVNLHDELSRVLEGASDDLRDLYERFIEWIRARDPNDILGPAGFGDAHFIPPDIRLDYRIRFENDPNATAPAQRVTIRHVLDSDLDLRSFRIGTFGFGDFVRNITRMQPILQETLNLTATLGVFVRVRGGIDIIRGEASWEFQSLDPLTGEPPVDPSIGFLPPNNLTSGQGFVTFSIFADDDVSNLATIDAEASIIFDANEPIDTPPIFNTIDRVHPEVNLTINNELLDANVLAVNVMKADSGSGVREVDLYQIIPGGNEIAPVVSGSTNDIVFLPLSEGTRFTLFSASVDNVGNQRPLQESMEDYVLLDFPIVQVTCLNNCSNNGNCTVFGDCLCEEGFYGSDCSQDMPPAEPPVFEIPPSVTGVENEPPVFQIGARIPGTADTGDLVVYVDNVPMGSSFNRGRREGDRWTFTPQDFGEVELTLPPGFSGLLEVDITAVAADASRQRSLVINIQPALTTPAVTVTRDTPMSTTEGGGSSDSRYFIIAVVVVVVVILIVILLAILIFCCYKSKSKTKYTPGTVANSMELK